LGLKKTETKQILQWNNFQIHAKEERIKYHHSALITIILSFFFFLWYWGSNAGPCAC
jgi:hypothetical protein